VVVAYCQRLSYFCLCDEKKSYFPDDKIAFSSKSDHPRTGYTDMLFCSCDLDLDPMTLIHKTKNVLKTYLHTEKNEISGSVTAFRSYSITVRQTDKQRDRHTDRQTDR